MTAQETVAEPAASERQKAEKLRRAYPGWRIWWGTATGGWLALKPSWVTLHCGLIHGQTVDEIAAEIAWIAQPAKAGAGHGPRLRSP